MDPLTATTTIITLVTFVKDLIDVGQSIKRSIEKVGKNRRRIRDLTADILRMLSDIGELLRGNANAFQSPELLSALGNLKADMVYVLAVCRKLCPTENSPGFRGFRSQIKTWITRDDVEEKIRHLRENVNKCYLQFTVTSAARIEHTSLRVEQTLIINNVENQVRLRRLEGMVAQVLLETQFGEHIMNQTIEIIASDTGHKTLEFQYLSI
ncbi:hypothetical protein C8R44DRAFT_990681, partial [Mycena epipterygia]